jgi:cytidylate kinase
MPVITISRMYGSGGSEVAARVAEALGWQLLDNALVDAVAEQTGLSRAEVAEQEERVPSMVQRLATALALGSPEIMPPIPAETIETTEERIVNITRRVIEQAVQTGPAVVVGRGAQSLLAERADALHVFCYAPRAVLRDNEMRKSGVSAEEADRRVADVNHLREQYVKRHFHRNWLAPECYHLCLNTNWLTVAGAAEIVVSAARMHGLAPRR